ncbi:MAG: NAD(P)H-dependent oxidoreductase [Bacteroidales bacterium]|nr:NAD(P)H-dependent oxidoreductase [Bacteroidales bacterium]
MEKKVLIINGHPNKDSLGNEIAQKYKNGAEKSGIEVSLINIIDLDFNPILKYGYKKDMEFEPDLEKVQKLIKESNHLVLIYPNWWGTYPALLKGFIERVFLPDFAFSYQKDSPMPIQLLKEKSARIFVTMDTPKWYYNLIYRKPGHNSMKKSILNFCGIKPVKITTFTPVRKSTDETRKKWLEKVFKLGKMMK